MVIDDQLGNKFRSAAGLKDISSYMHKTDKMFHARHNSATGPLVEAPQLKYPFIDKGHLAMLSNNLISWKPKNNKIEALAKSLINKAGKNYEKFVVKKGTTTRLRSIEDEQREKMLKEAHERIKEKAELSIENAWRTKHNLPLKVLLKKRPV